MSTPTNILEIANHLVSEDRNAVYGAPIDNHACTGKMFYEWETRFLTSGATEKLDLKTRRAVAVCVFNICQKLSRLANDPLHYDTLVDIPGYARNLEMILHPDRFIPDDLPF